MKLKKGRNAPLFEIQDIYQHDVNFESYKGQKVLLSFFRNTACPFCNLRVYMLSKMNVKLSDMGLAMIFFFESKPEVILRSTFHDGLKIPLIGDPEHKVYKLYKVEKSIIKVARTYFDKDLKATVEKIKKLDITVAPDEDASKTLIPADFLINPDQTIHTAHYGRNLKDHLPMEAIQYFAAGKV